MPARRKAPRAEPRRSSKRIRTPSSLAANAAAVSDFFEEESRGRRKAQRRNATSDAASVSSEAPQQPRSAGGNRPGVLGSIHDVLTPSTPEKAGAVRGAAARPGRNTPISGSESTLPVAAEPWRASAVDPTAASASSSSAPSRLGTSWAATLAGQGGETQSPRHTSANSAPAPSALDGESGDPKADGGASGEEGITTRPSSPSVPLVGTGDLAASPAVVPPALPSVEPAAAAAASGSAQPSTAQSSAAAWAREVVEDMQQELAEGSAVHLPSLAASAACLERAARLADVHGAAMRDAAQRSCALPAPLQDLLCEEALAPGSTLPPGSKVVAARRALDRVAAQAPYTASALRQALLGTAFLPFLTTLTEEVKASVDAELAVLLDGARVAVVDSYVLPLVGMLQCKADARRLDGVKVQALMAAQLAWHACRALMVHAPASGQLQAAYCRSLHLQVAVLRVVQAQTSAAVTQLAALAMAGLSEGVLDAVLRAREGQQLPGCPIIMPRAPGSGAPSQAHARNVLRFAAEAWEARSGAAFPQARSGAGAFFKVQQAAEGRAMLRAKMLLQALQGGGGEKEQA